ncbi:MAG: aldo/keto reductase [Planctomycetota bacterium]|jgi:aryl-alcohol dehydrogenase-like predicted oxidoreductase
MDYRKLGKTELMVSPLCIGAWQLGGPLAFDGKPDGHPDPGKENVLRLIRELGDRGINHIDTAEQYGNGESERRVGQAIAGCRDKWIISTKFGYRVGPDGSRVDDSGPATILSSLEGSLKRLATDMIDIYLFHCAPKLEDLDESRAILEQAKQAGKIRYYGISTANLELAESLHERSMLDVLQHPMSLLDPRQDVDAFVGEHNIGTQVRGIMAQGRLSGKYFQRRPTWRTDDNRSQWFKDEDYTRYRAFENALPEGMTMAQAAIRWVLDKPIHHTICMGAKNLADYETAIEAVNMPPLSDETNLKLDKCASALRG